MVLLNWKAQNRPGKLGDLGTMNSTGNPTSLISLINFNEENDEMKRKPAVASAMTWSSTYVLLVLLILPKNNLTCLDWMTGS